MQLIQTFSKDKSHQKVRDHCHFTSKYRGAAHSIFKLRFNMPNDIPVVFHKGTNYNYHFIMRESSKVNLIILEKIQESTKLVNRKVPIEKYIKRLIKMVMRVL